MQQALSQQNINLKNVSCTFTIIYYFNNRVTQVSKEIYVNSSTKKANLLEQYTIIKIGTINLRNIFSFGKCFQ